MHCILCILLLALYSMHSILYCILCILLIALYYMHCILCFVFHALYSIHCILCIVFFALYSMHCILCIFSYAFYFIDFILCIVFCAYWTNFETYSTLPKTASSRRLSKGILNCLKLHGNSGVFPHSGRGTQNIKILVPFWSLKMPYLREESWNHIYNDQFTKTAASKGEVQTLECSWVLSGACCPGPGGSQGNLAVLPASKEAESPSNLILLVLLGRG